jgi:hypothetical protein
MEKKMTGDTKIDYFTTAQYITIAATKDVISPLFIPAKPPILKTIDHDQVERDARVMTALDKMDSILPRKMGLKPRPYRTALY